MLSLILIKIKIKKAEKLAHYSSDFVFFFQKRLKKIPIIPVAMQNSTGRQQLGLVIFKKIHKLLTYSYSTLPFFQLQNLGGQSTFGKHYINITLSRLISRSWVRIPPE